MFVTTPAMEQPVPEGIGAIDHRYWLSVSLSSQSHWYLVSFRADAADGHLPVQTVAVAWESMLITLLSGIRSRDDVHSIQVVTRRPDKSARWRMHEVSELWIPSLEEASETGPLLMRLQGSAQLLDSFQTEVRSDKPGRVRLLAFAFDVDIV